MNYQLANGKVIYLSIEEYLSLTDEDIQYLIASDYGDVITNPFSGSAVDTKKKPEDQKELRDFISFNDDGEEFPHINLSDLS
jgi:hypothetical protein